MSQVSLPVANAWVLIHETSSGQCTGFCVGHELSELAGWKNRVDIPAKGACGIARSVRTPTGRWRVHRSQAAGWCWRRTYPGAALWAFRDATGVLACGLGFCQNVVVAQWAPRWSWWDGSLGGTGFPTASESVRVKGGRGVPRSRPRPCFPRVWGDEKEVSAGGSG